MFIQLPVKAARCLAVAFYVCSCLPCSQTDLVKLSIPKHCWSLLDTENVECVCCLLSDQYSHLWVSSPGTGKRTYAQLWWEMLQCQGSCDHPVKENVSKHRP